MAHPTKAHASEDCSARSTDAKSTGAGWPRAVTRPGLPPSPGSARALVPPLQRHYQGTATSCRPSRRTSLPSLGGTVVAPRFRSRRGGMLPRRAWSWSPGISRRDLPRRRQDLPSSWGTSIAHLHMLLDSGGTIRSRPFGTGARPWVEARPRLPRETDFRS